MKTVYKLYRDRLVEISGRSRSLYSKSITKKQAYNLARLFTGNPSDAADFCGFLWGENKRKIKLLTESHLTSIIKAQGIPVSREQIQKISESEYKHITGLKREVEEIEKETGRYELFVGYPFVEGVINNDVQIKAPLLLFPARIDTENGLELELLKEEPVQLNKVFLLAYSKELRVSTDDMVMEFEHILSQMPSIPALKDYLKKFGVNLKYSAPRTAVADIEKSKESKDGALEILHYCVLGRYPLANSIYYDYNILEKKNLSSPALTALLDNRPIKNKEPKQLMTYPVHQLDYAQEQCLEDLSHHGNLVIYGPPGTGKSQTLANMISDALCKSKRVLVVSQKRAALDVVFNRLNRLNTKAISLPDPEKSKTEFYIKVREKHEQLMRYKPRFNKESFEKVSADIDSEINDLQTISAALFTDTAFGLNLQEMYTMSANIGKESEDYNIYRAMLDTPVMKLNYSRLYEAHTRIKQLNKGNLYYDHLKMTEKSPLIEHIKTDIDIHSLNKIRTFITRVINNEIAPFDIAGYQYSRYMLVYSLESDTKSLKPLADMIVNTEHPELKRQLKVSAFPLFWLGYPAIWLKYSAARREVTQKLETARNAVRRYVSEFELLKDALEPKGFNMVIDSIVYGNDKFLRSLLDAFDDYLTIRDINLTLQSLTADEKLLLAFARNNSDSREKFNDILNKILAIRVYHEVIIEEKQKEHILSKTIIYNDIRNRIMKLKGEQRKLNTDLAMDNFVAEYKSFFETNPENSNNFLHQINKQNNLWPIRRLIEYFEEYLMRMYPCWLLSPEAVSAILPLKADLFDIALFDEASQVFIESTIPAIYRAKSIVVSGDNKQLRPTSTFVKRYMGDDTYNADLSLNAQAVMEVDSLLDLATSRLRASNLTYHYRSRYEELINFSNYAFYNGRLQISPNISRNTNYLPIERIKVNGLWENRRNTQEAEAVVRLVKNILSTRKNSESIGIVTFNSEQEEYIKDCLDAEAARDASFKRLYFPELNRRVNNEDIGLFVKNLENVQGDERDIIIFSVAYARNEDGKLNAQFGSLSLSGGENRLNVAITRAKEKIYVVTSVEPEEFTSIDTSKNLGPKLLKKYLQYARAVSGHNRDESRIILKSLLYSPRTATRDRDFSRDAGNFEYILKDELEKRGYLVDVNVGNSDYKLSLAVYDKAIDRYVLGLECDYTAYASSTSVLERDVYRNNFLESRGWRIMRIWSRDWWLNRNTLIKNIEKEIKTSITYYNDLLTEQLNRELEKALEATDAAAVADIPEATPVKKKKSSAKKSNPPDDAESRDTAEEIVKASPKKSSSPRKPAAKA